MFDWLFFWRKLTTPMPEMRVAVYEVPPAPPEPEPVVLEEVTCDRCVDPGHCCRAFPLTMRVPIGSSKEAVDRQMRASLEASEEPLGWGIYALYQGHVPYEPLRRLKIGGYGSNPDDQTIETWLFKCNALQPDGRCGVWAKRPYVCKIYDPGCDHMCVHMRGKDGKPIVPLKPFLQLHSPEYYEKQGT